MQSSEIMINMNEEFLNDSRKPLNRIREKKDKKSSSPIFITKTYQILESGNYDDVIAWNQQGTSFTINDVEKFQDSVLPTHFRHRNFSSFVRQLNMYDFHKIRNDHNKNIFEHKEFKRNHKELLKNIKRKGCNIKKSLQNVQDQSYSYNEQAIYENESTPRRLKAVSQQKYNLTIQSIQKGSQSAISSLRIIHNIPSPSPQKRHLLQQFISTLPQTLSCEQQMQGIISCLKIDPKYSCFNKKDIRQLISRIRHKLPMGNMDDLQELSIQEEIFVRKVYREDQHKIDSLNVVQTHRYLPKSINLICSLNFFQDAEHLFYHKLY